MKYFTTRVPNYRQVHFPYSTVTSACQGSGPLPLQYSNVCLSREWSSLYSHCYYF